MHGRTDEACRGAVKRGRGEVDPDVLALNREALEHLTCEKRLQLVPDATHLFEEPGTLERVADLASQWVAGHVTSHGRSTSGERHDQT